MANLHSRRTYDYRIQEAICETGDRDLFPELNNSQNKRIPLAAANEILLGGARDRVRTGDWPNGQYSLIARGSPFRSQCVAIVDFIDFLEVYRA